MATDKLDVVRALHMARAARELDLLLVHLRIEDKLTAVKLGAPGSISRLMDAIEAFTETARALYEEG